MLPSSLELFIRDFSATDRFCFYTFRSSFPIRSNGHFVARNVIVQRTKKHPSSYFIYDSYSVPI